MKKLLTICVLFFASLTASSQAKDPVKWFASYKSISATEGEIIITAMIDKNWHIYSQTLAEDGPIPTSFAFTPGKNFQLNGKAQEIGAHEIFDNAFQAKISSFSDKAEFHQKIKLSGKPGFSIPFKVEYMSCDDKMCLPPKTIELSVKTQ